MSIGVARWYRSMPSRILRQMVEAGLIPATRVRGLLCFRKVDHDALLERLIAKATEIAPHDSLDTLADAAFLAKCPTMRVVRGIAWGISALKDVFHAARQTMVFRREKLRYFINQKRCFPLV